MFQFSAYPSFIYVFNKRSPINGVVNLFGNLGIKASWQLPQAYRNHVRPSSVLSTKASAACIIVEYSLAFSFKLQSLATSINRNNLVLKAV